MYLKDWIGGTRWVTGFGSGEGWRGAQDNWTLQTCVSQWAAGTEARGGLATDTARRCTVFKMVAIISQGVMAADSSQKSLLWPKGAALLKGISPPPCQGKPIFHDWLIRDTKTRSPFLNSGKLWRAIPAPELLKTTEALLCPGHTSASPGAESRFPRWPPGAAPWSTPQKTYRFYFSGGRTCDRGDDIQVFVFFFL